jgi:hypothetical protein
MPLLAALYSSVQILDAVVHQSVATVFSSVDRVKRSRAVVELFQDQERMARLYDVLGEPVQLQNVNRAHLEIEKALEDLLPSGGNEQLGQLIGELKSRVN